MCIGVPVARTGWLEYLPEEVPEDVAKGLESGQMVKVYRSAEDLFAAATMASFEGKPLTLNHPEDFVDPTNWRDYCVGHAQNARRGIGSEADMLLLDILITDAEAIKMVQSGELQEVSCGYDAGYEAVGAGVGRQLDIIGNHIALVEFGRCGSRCAIKDSNPKESRMNSTKKSFWDRLMRSPKVMKAMDEVAKEMEQDPEKSKDAEPAANTTDEGGDKLDEILVLLRTLVEQKKASDEDAVVTDDEPASAENKDPECIGDEDPEKAEDEDKQAGRTGDKATSRVADSGLIARAARLAPSLRFRVGDSARMVQRTALGHAMADKAISGIVGAVLQGKTLDSADNASLTAAFVAASEIMAAKTNNKTADNLIKISARDFGKSITPADINKMNREYHDKKGGK